MKMADVRPGTLFQYERHPDVLFQREEEGSLVSVFGILCTFNAVGLQQEGSEHRSYWNLCPDDDVIPIWN